VRDRQKRVRGMSCYASSGLEEVKRRQRGSPPELKPKLFNKISHCGVSQLNNGDKLP